MYTTRMEKNIRAWLKGIDHESGERQRQKKNAIVDKKEKTIFFLFIPTAGIILSTYLYVYYSSLKEGRVLIQ